MNKNLKEPVTFDYLKKAAFYYLARYASSKENLRNVLIRKIEMRVHDFCRKYPDKERNIEDYFPLVDQIVELCVNHHFVDDLEYTRMKVSSLRQKAKSTKHIKNTLKAKGISNEILDDVIGDNPEEEFNTARLFAKKKRLGPYRLNNREEYRMKDIAKMVRAGFSLNDVYQIIDQTDLMSM